MPFRRGDRVEVVGFAGARGVLIVWESREPRALLLCSEEGYARLRRGEEAPVVGFPMHDIVGRAGYGEGVRAG